MIMISTRVRFTGILAALVIGATGAQVATSYTREDCHPVASGTDAEWAELFHDGWHGHATDGQEAIYPPGC